VLVSAADSSKAWDLRCEVREKLIAFIRKDYPDALPRRRTEALIERVASHDGAEPPAEIASSDVTPH
jgi:hypothetical protein